MSAEDSVISRKRPRDPSDPDDVMHDHDGNMELEATNVSSKRAAVDGTGAHAPAAAAPADSGSADRPLVAADHSAHLEQLVAEAAAADVADPGSDRSAYGADPGSDVAADGGAHEPHPDQPDQNDEQAADDDGGGQEGVEDADDYDPYEVTTPANVDQLCTAWAQCGIKAGRLGLLNDALQLTKSHILALSPPFCAAWGLQHGADILVHKEVDGHLYYGAGEVRTFRHNLHSSGALRELTVKLLPGVIGLYHRGWRRASEEEGGGLVAILSTRPQPRLLPPFPTPALVERLNQEREKRRLMEQQMLASGVQPGRGVTPAMAGGRVGGIGTGGGVGSNGGVFDAGKVAGAALAAARAQRMSDQLCEQWARAGISKRQFGVALAVQKPSLEGYIHITAPYCIAWGLQEGQTISVQVEDDNGEVAIGEWSSTLEDPQRGPTCKSLMLTVPPYTAGLFVRGWRLATAEEGGGLVMITSSYDSSHTLPPPPPSGNSETPLPAQPIDEWADDDQPAAPPARSKAAALSRASEYQDPDPPYVAASGKASSQRAKTAAATVSALAHAVQTAVSKGAPPEAPWRRPQQQAPPQYPAPASSHHVPIGAKPAHKPAPGAPSSTTATAAAAAVPATQHASAQHAPTGMLSTTATATAAHSAAPAAPTQDSAATRIPIPVDYVQSWQLHATGTIKAAICIDSFAPTSNQQFDVQLCHDVPSDAWYFAPSPPLAAALTGLHVRGFRRREVLHVITSRTNPSHLPPPSVKLKLPGSGSVGPPVAPNVA